MAVLQYRKLLNHEIRVFTLLPGGFDQPLTGKLEHRRFIPADGDTPKYEAVSYVWAQGLGSDSLCVQFDTKLGELQIGANLALALRHLRHQDENRTLWCDYICINQRDIVERAEQVQGMGDIYREAESVIVWLGPDAEDSAIAIETLDRIGSQIDFDRVQYIALTPVGADPIFADTTSDLPCSEREWTAIKRLVARPWFKRLWIRQEIALAGPAALVMAGHSSIAWSRLISAAACTELKVAYETLSTEVPHEFISNIRNVVSLARTGLFRTPVALLNSTRFCQCTDDRDRVYALLGFLDDHYGIEPDYSLGVVEINREFMVSVQQYEHRIDLLALCDPESNPSWVPTLDGRRAIGSSFWRNFATGYSKSSLDVVEEGDVAEVEGICCGKVSKVLGTIPIDCSDDELKNAVKTILRSALGTDPTTWDMESARKLAQALLGGHWWENTKNLHDPPIIDAVSIVKNWMPDEARRKLRGSELDNDVKTTWAILNASSGRSVLQMANGLFGLGPEVVASGNVIYALLGCKDLIVLRDTGIAKGFVVVGPAYIFELSCGQVLLSEADREHDWTFIKASSTWHGAGLSVTMDIPLDSPDGHPLFSSGGANSSSTDVDIDFDTLVLRGKGVAITTVTLL